MKIRCKEITTTYHYVYPKQQSNTTALGDAPAEFEAKKYLRWRELSLGRPSSNGRRRSSAARRAESVRLAAARRRRTQQEIVELRSRRESFAEASPHELADAHVVDVADGASEIAAEEVHEVKAEARSSRDFSLELGDFFDGLGPAAYAQEAPPVDDESDDETKTPS